MAAFLVFGQAGSAALLQVADTGEQVSNCIATCWQGMFLA